ncbi:MAG: HU family DNA-binding protein [Nitrospirota bacterium]
MKDGTIRTPAAPVLVPAKKVPFFKAGKELKELLNK